MESSLSTIKSLYEQEIDAYKKQLDELKDENRENVEKNSALLNKVKELDNLIEKAHSTNRDLHSAFEHVREENLRLKSQSNNQEKVVACPENEERALETMQRQFVNLAGESVSWLSEKDKLIQRIKFLERECGRYTRDNTTLGKQVRHLLKTLEEERGMIVRRSNQVKEYGDITTASDVIDNHLITFESIEALQQQNQRLLSLVKELSEREEERELQTQSDDNKRLNSDIEALKTQLEAIKDDRERIMTAFKTILKERDLFKILLCKTKQVEHLTPEVFQRMVSIAVSSGPALGIEAPEVTQDNGAHLADLKEIISKLEHELADLRNEHQQAISKSEAEIKLKTDLLEQAHLKLLSESQQLEVLKERNTLLEDNTKSLMDEYDEVRTRLQKMTYDTDQLKKEKQVLVDALDQEKQRKNSEVTLMEQNQTLESTIVTLKGELSEARTKSQLLALQLEHIEREKTILSQTLDQERHRQSELSTILVEIQSRNDLRFELQMKLQAAEQEIQVKDQIIREMDEQRAELQRLRNMERSARLELFRKLSISPLKMPNKQPRPMRVKKRPKTNERSLTAPCVPPTVTRKLSTVPCDLPTEQILLANSQESGVVVKPVENELIDQVETKPLNNTAPPPPIILKRRKLN